MAKMVTVRLLAPFDEFFHQSKSGAIWGRVYFEFGEGAFFPEKGWTDLVAAFLRGWLTALLSERESLRFHRVACRREDGILIVVSLLRDFSTRDHPKFAYILKNSDGLSHDWKPDTTSWIEALCFNQKSLGMTERRRCLEV